MQVSSLGAVLRCLHEFKRVLKSTPNVHVSSLDAVLRCLHESKRVFKSTPNVPKSSLDAVLRCSQTSILSFFFLVILLIYV